MKYYTRLILMGLSAFCSVVYANEGMLNSQIPQQSFHQANATGGNDDAVAIQQVREIMARAHQMQAQKEKQEQQLSEIQAAPASTPTPQNSAAQSSTPKTTPPVSSVPRTQTSVALIPTGDVKAQLTSLAQQNLLFRQQTDSKIESLTTQNRELQGKLQQLSQVLAAMNQEVIQLTSRIQAAKNSLGKTPLFFTGQAMQYSLYAIIALLLAVIGMLIPRRSRRDQQTKPMTPKQSAFAQSMVKAGVVPMKPAALLDDTQDEYDFMGSREAIPAKLDLARAYIAMEDFVSARHVLQEVMKLGTEEQRQEALKLFEKIPATQ